MSEITDLTAAVKALTAQLKGKSGPKTAEERDEARKERKAERIEDLRERNILLIKEKELIAEINEDEKEKAKLLNENKLEQIKVLKEKLRLEELDDNARKNTIEEIKKLTSETKEYTETTEKATKAIEEQTKAFKAGAGEADNLLNRFLSLSGEGKAFFSIIGNGTVGLAGFVTGLAKSVFTGDLLVKSFQKLIGNSINFAFELDRQNAQFKAVTGAGDEFSGVLDEAGSRYLTYGINAKDAGKATQALFGSFRDFTNLSESEQANIAATAATLDKFGVSGQTTGKILDQATKSLYMNSQQAETLTRQAATLAISIGKPISEVASDMASAAPKLAFYGKQMFDVFAQLERQSKATGLSVDTLLGLVGEKFDTFKGAGEAVGRLNAILGGPYLNSIEMLNAEEPERLQMIKETIEAYGGQFDALNKFEQKAFASAMGTDVDTLRRMLNDLDPEVQLQAMRQEELAKRAGDARDIMTKLTDAINSLIIKNKPLMDSIVEGVDKFSDLIYQINAGEKSIDSLKKAFIDLIPTEVKVIGGIALIVNGAIKMHAAFKAIAAAKAAVASFFATTTAGAASTTAAASPLLAVLLPIAAIVGGLGLGAVAISKASKAAAAGEQGKAMGFGMGGGAASGALAGAGLGFMIGGPAGAAIGGLIGGVAGLATGTLAAGGTFNDATTQVPIQMAKFNNQDTFERVGNTVVAAKPDGTLDKAIREASEKQTAVLVEAIQNALNVNVQIGDKQLNGMVITALNSPEGKRSISPFYQGAGSLTG
ncbi:MAG: hypothetical protein VW683_06500 [Betaproteobacteria bacterium]